MTIADMPTLHSDLASGCLPVMTGDVAEMLMAHRASPLAWAEGRLAAPGDDVFVLFLNACALHLQPSAYVCATGLHATWLHATRLHSQAVVPCSAASCQNPPQRALAFDQARRLAT